MNLTISGHHLEVTPALRNYVTTKLDRITRHFDQVVDVKVLLTVEKQKENATSTSREATCLQKAPISTCMPLWTSSWTRWIARSCAIKTASRTTTTHPNARCSRKPCRCAACRPQPPPGAVFLWLAGFDQGFCQCVHNCFLDHEPTRIHPALRSSARER